MRPTHVTALYRARQAACNAAAAAAAAVAAEARAAAAAAQRQRREDAASLLNLGRQKLGDFQDSVLQHRKLAKLIDPMAPVHWPHETHLRLLWAKHFLCEKTGGTITQPVFSNCRYKGKVQLPPIRRYPPYWVKMMRRRDAFSSYVLHLTDPHCLTTLQAQQQSSRNVQNEDSCLGYTCHS